MEKQELIDEELIVEEKEPKKKKGRKKRFFTKKRKRQLKYLGLFLLFMLGAYIVRRIWLSYDRDPIAPKDYTEQIKVSFLYVDDGDTAVFKDAQGKEIICRFLAVDTPEIGAEGGVEAKDYTRNILASSYEIILELDPASERYDKYDRLLAWVWVDGRLLQGKLIENDLAQIRYIYGDYLYTEHLYSLEKNR